MNATRGKTTAASTPGSFAPHSRSDSEAELDDLDIGDLDPKPWVLYQANGTSIRFARIQDAAPITALRYAPRLPLDLRRDLLLERFEGEGAGLADEMNVLLRDMSTAQDDERAAHDATMSRISERAEELLGGDSFALYQLAGQRERPDGYVDVVAVGEDVALGRDRAVKFTIDPDGELTHQDV